MKKLLITISLLLAFFNTYAQKQLKSNKKRIVIETNSNKISLWRISPEVAIDRYHAFCWKEFNEVKFITDIDSIVFNIKESDTVRFEILLNGTDTATTEVVGVKEFPNKITKKEKIYFLSLLWSEAKNNFMNYDKLALNLDSLYMELIQEVSVSKNDYEYYRILEKFVASLGDGHSQVYKGRVFGSYTDYVPIGLANIKEKIYLVRFRKFLEDSLVLGSELVAVNGIPTEEFMEKEILPYISGSTKQWKWQIGKNKICLGKKGDSISLKFKSPHGELNEIKLAYNGESTRYNRKGENRNESVGVHSKYAKNLTLNFTKDSIAILTLNRLYPENVKQVFTKLLPELYKAKGLVIDMRSNSGGSTSIAEFILQYIIEEDMFLSLASECRVSDAVYKALGIGYDEYKPYYEGTKYRQIPADTIFVADSIRKLDYPISILIGGMTFSAAEDFLIILYEHKNRPLLIGSPTGGSTGSPLVIPDLPYNGLARICTRRCKFPYSGKKFVNKGIEPDIEIHPTITDILENKDVVLERGVLEVRKRLD